MAIERIDIRVTATAAAYPGCAATDGIDTMQAAVMSIPFAVASTLRAGRLDPSAWTNFAQSGDLRPGQRCNVVADEVLTAPILAATAPPLRCECVTAARSRPAADDFVSMDAAAVSGRFRADAEHWIGRDQAETTSRQHRRLGEAAMTCGFLAECCAARRQSKVPRAGARAR